MTELIEKLGLDPAVVLLIIQGVIGVALAMLIKTGIAKITLGLIASADNRDNKNDEVIKIIMNQQQTLINQNKTLMKVKIVEINVRKEITQDLNVSKQCEQAIKMLQSHDND